MSSQPKYTNPNFASISIDNFLQKHKKKNKKENIAELKEQLLYFKKLKTAGATCDCGNEIWIIGSAFSGKTCFTCLTGESDPSNDYEIE